MLTKLRWSVRVHADETLSNELIIKVSPSGDALVPRGRAAMATIRKVKNVCVKYAWPILYRNKRSMCQELCSRDCRFNPFFCLRIDWVGFIVRRDMGQAENSAIHEFEAGWRFNGRNSYVPVNEGDVVNRRNGKR